MDMIRKRLNDPEKILTPRTVHSKKKLTNLETYGKQISSNENVSYCTHTKSN